MSHPSVVSIIPTEFKETCVGKTFSASKVRAEFHMLLNHRVKLCIEVINSRFSRKKVINMNGEPVSTFSKMSVGNLRWHWTYLIDGESIEFNVVSNSSGTGVDLQINGRDFFDYVQGVVDADAAASSGMRETGLSRLNTSIVFKVPVQSIPKVIETKKLDPLPPMTQGRSTAHQQPITETPKIHSEHSKAPNHLIVKEPRESNRTTKLPSSTKYVPFKDVEPLIDL